jgi:hypothetical protein
MKFYQSATESVLRVLDKKAREVDEQAPNDLGEQVQWSTAAPDLELDPTPRDVVITSYVRCRQA